MRGAVRWWWLDAGLAVVVVCHEVAVLLFDLYGESVPARVSVPLVVASGALLGLTRRWPVAVTAAQFALLVGAAQLAPVIGDAIRVHAAVALAVLAYRRGWLLTAAGFALMYAAVLINISQVDGPVLDGPQGLIRLWGIALLCATPVLFSRWLRGLRAAARVAQERARDAELRRVVETRAARLAERTQMARDLHDILAHHVGAIALRASTAHFTATQTGRLDEATAALTDVRAAAGEVLQELGELLVVLRDPDTVDSGPSELEPELMITEAASRVRAAGLQVDVEVDRLLAGLPLVVRTTAARIVQEGLTNALKHAGPAASARVGIGVEAACVIIEVTDDGLHAAKPALPTSGHGLTGLRERAALLGGSVTAGPTAPAGWQLRAWLPLKNA